MIPVQVVQLEGSIRDSSKGFDPPKVSWVPELKTVCELPLIVNWLTSRDENVCVEPAVRVSVLVAFCVGSAKLELALAWLELRLRL